MLCGPGWSAGALVVARWSMVSSRRMTPVAALTTVTCRSWTSRIRWFGVLADEPFGVRVEGGIQGAAAGLSDGASTVVVHRIDPLAVWIFGGPVAGAGAVIAFIGGLRWLQANRGRL